MPASPDRKTPERTGSASRKRLPLPGIAALALLLGAILLYLFLFRDGGKKEPAAEAPLRIEALPSAAPAEPESPPEQESREEGVMDYAAYAAARSGSPVVIEAYVQDRQDWWNGTVTVYAQDPDGGYFLFDLACPLEDGPGLTPGRKIRVSGLKSVYRGHAEIIQGSFSFVDAEPWLAEPEDVTELLGTEELILRQNRLVTFRDMTVEPYDESGAAFAYKDPEGQTDDLLFKVSRDGAVYEFCVEFYLRGSDTEVYRTVETLRVGDRVDLEGFLYWDEGPDPHITAVTVK